MQSPSPSEPQSSTEHRLRQELIAQGRFLDGLVRSLGAVSGYDDDTAGLADSQHLMIAKGRDVDGQRGMERDLPPRRPTTPQNS